MRIAVGGFMHETNTFAPTKATSEKFERADSWPGLQTGPSVLTETVGVNGRAQAAQVIQQAHQWPPQSRGERLDRSL